MQRYQSNTRIPWVVVLGLATGLISILWAMTRETRKWERVLIGPYRVPIVIEQVLGVVAALCGAASAAWYLRARIKGFPLERGLTRWSAGILLFTAAYGTIAWRSVTESFDGASIGGDFFLFVSPFVIGGLVMVAVASQQSANGSSSQRKRVFLLEAALIAPVLFAAALCVYK